MQALLEAITADLGAGAVLTGDAVTERSAGIWRSDGLVAGAVVRPRNTDEVAAVLAHCHAAGQGVVVHGGLTGLVHGADASAEELVLSTERMTAIEDIDPVQRTVRVQAGVPLQVLQEAVADYDLIFPLDLGARGSCRIGGNLATNAGGNRVVRYGMTRENTLGVEAVLADGTVVPALNAMIKNNSGFDLKHLFIGTEGTLGVVTRAVLRLREAPLSRVSALLAVPDFAALTALLKRLDSGLGGGLSAFEVMWKDFYDVVSRPPHRSQPPLAVDAPFYVLCEAMGGDPEGDAARFERVLAAALEAGCAIDAVLADSDARQADLWRMRDAVDALFEFGPYQIFDVSLPIPAMDRYVEDVRRGVEAIADGARLFTFGHLGDGNLHFCAAPGSADAATVAAVEEAVYGPLAALGGGVSAEHGIGLEKKAWLARTRSEAELGVMRTLRAALDPKGILNPGKVL